MVKKVATFYKEAASAVDAGLRRYMLSVFSYMSGGLAVTAAAAYLTSMSPTIMSLLFGNQAFFLMVALAPLGISIYLVSRLARISVEKARALFYIYATCLGVSLGSLFVVYSGSSITQAFFASSSMFLSMVVYGYVTEKDLTAWGSFLIMGLIGIVVASIVNIFTKSPGFSFVVSLLGVVLFTGLTAYDTQTIKNYYYDSDSADISEKKAIYGALHLYLDFINLFLSILRLTGSRRD
jgi:FtsH-binding integral membrane protein